MPPDRVPGQPFEAPANLGCAQREYPCLRGPRQNADALVPWVGTTEVVLQSEAHATERRQEGIMKMLSGSLALVLLLGTVPVVWAQADPAKAIADINRKRGEAGAKGDVDGVLADVADNVVLTAARAGFRMEGRRRYGRSLPICFRTIRRVRNWAARSRTASFRKATSSWSTGTTTRRSSTRTGR